MVCSYLGCLILGIDTRNWLDQSYMIKMESDDLGPVLNGCGSGFPSLQMYVM